MLFYSLKIRTTSLPFPSRAFVIRSIILTLEKIAILTKNEYDDKWDDLRMRGSRSSSQSGFSAHIDRILFSQSLQIGRE